MRKGMLSGLWSLKWVLLCLLLTGCPKSDPPPPPPPPSPDHRHRASYARPGGRRAQPSNSDIRHRNERAYSAKDRT
jgi:hypothetical protein